MSKIICGTYHCRKIIQINKAKKELITLIPFKVRKENIFDKCILCGVDKTRCYVNNEYVPLRLFSPSKFRDHTILVLTSRERHYLRVACGYTNIKIIALEKEVPYLRDLKYINDAKKNFYYLNRIFPKSKALYGKPFSYYSNYFFNKLAKKIKKISSLDQQFALTQSGGVQEVFTLKETRPNRRIITYDFNSMYPSCIVNAIFPDPRKLIYKKINSNYDDKKEIGYGVFHVILSKPKDDFVKKYHSIKFNYLTKPFIFQIRDDDTVETLLHTNEIKFYSKHFKQIQIIEGIFSEKGIKHPLSNTIKKLYKRRLAAKKNNNKEYEAFIKQLLTICCSSSKSSRKRSATLNPIEINQLFNFLNEELGLDIPNNMPRSLFLKMITSRNKFHFRTDGESIYFDYPRYSSPQQVSVFSSYLFAEARIKMLNAMEYITSFKECDVEICYVNVDSVHINVPLEYGEKLKKYIVNGGLADTTDDVVNGTPKLGKLKLEYEADKGIWLSPGRYWLFKDNNLLAYVNALMNIKRIHSIAAQEKTFDIRKIIDNDLVYLTRKRLTIASCLSFSKKISSSDNKNHLLFERFNFNEIKDFKHIESSIKKEKKKNKPTILEIYGALTEYSEKK